MVVGNEWWVVFLQNIQLVLRISLKVNKTLVWQVLYNLSLACLLRSDLAELSKQRGSTTFLMSVSAKKQIENWIIKYLFKKYSEKKLSIESESLRAKIVSIFSRLVLLSCNSNQYLLFLQAPKIQKKKSFMWSTNCTWFSHLLYSIFLGF